MNKGKRMAALLLSCLLAFGIVMQPVTANVALAESEVVTGRYSGFTWSFDPEQGLLVIFGVDALPKLSDPVPWAAYADQIVRIIFRSGITEIPEGFFRGLVNLSDVLIPATVVSIGDGLFAENQQIKNVAYEGDQDAFLAILSGADKAQVQEGQVTVNRYEETTQVDEQGNVTYEYRVISNDGVTGTMYVTYGKDSVTTIVRTDTGEEYGVIKYSDGREKRWYFNLNTNQREYYWVMPDGTVYDSEGVLDPNSMVFSESDGTEIYIKYLDKGKLIQTNYPDGTVSVVVYREDETTRAIWEQSPDGIEVMTLYREDGETVWSISTTNSDGSKAEVGYREDGVTKEYEVETHIDGSKVEIIYWEDGITVHQSTETYVDGSSKVTQYKADGSVLIVEFDSTGKKRNAKQTNADGSTIEENYAEDGSVYRVEQDSTGKTVSEIMTNADGSSKQTFYNADGSTTVRELDSENQLVSSVDTNADGFTIEKTYNADGSVYTVTKDPNGITQSEIQRNVDGSVTKTEYKADGSSVVTEHDSTGTLVSEIRKNADGSGEKVTREYVTDDPEEGVGVGYWLDSIERFDADGNITGTTKQKQYQTDDPYYPISRTEQYDADGVFIEAQVNYSDGTYAKETRPADGSIKSESYTPDGTYYSTQIKYPNGYWMVIYSDSGWYAFDDVFNQIAAGRVGEDGKYYPYDEYYQLSDEEYDISGWFISTAMAMFGVDIFDEHSAEEVMLMMIDTDDTLFSQDDKDKLNSIFGIEAGVADEEIPAEETPDEEIPTEEPVDEEPVDEEPVDEEPVNEELVDEEPVDEEPVDEKPVDEEPVDEEPVDEDVVYQTDKDGNLILDENGNAIPVIIVPEQPAELAPVLGEEAA